MKDGKNLLWLTIIILGVFACSNQSSTTSQVTNTKFPSDSTVQEITLAPSLPPQATTIVPVEPTPTTDPAKFPLGNRGPYWTGRKEITLFDDRRDEREITLTVWYPALKQTDANGKIISQNAVPDMSKAPYPVIMTGSNSGDYLFKSHLASHGFVMVIVRSPEFSYEAPWNNSVIDGPLDFLFALDDLTSNPPEGLEDVLDTNRVGVAGYSSDGLFSLALGGARINPEYYFSQCAQASSLDSPLSPSLINYYCKLSRRWDEFSSQIGADISTVSEGLWQSTTDDRILAVMPMAPDSAWLYGVEGLAAINIPSLIIAGTDDNLASYKLSSCYIYEHLMNSDTSLISFIGKGHMMVQTSEVISRINHFSVAFFGYHLQGREDYAYYFSDEFVAQFDDLAWGVYPQE